MAAAGEVLVPIQCEYYALEGLGQLLRNVDLVKPQPQPPARDVSTIVLRHVRRSDQAGRPGGRPRCASTSATRCAARPWSPVTCASRRRRRSGSRSSSSTRTSAVGPWPIKELAKEVSRWRDSAVSVGDSDALIPVSGGLHRRRAPAATVHRVSRRCRSARSAQSAPAPRPLRRGALSDLAASIREIGVLQPVLVRSGRPAAATS